MVMLVLVVDLPVEQHQQFMKLFNHELAATNGIVFV